MQRKNKLFVYMASLLIFFCILSCRGSDRLTNVVDESSNFGINTPTNTDLEAIIANIDNLDSICCQCIYEKHQTFDLATNEGLFFEAAVYLKPDYTLEDIFADNASVVKKEFFAPDHLKWTYYRVKTLNYTKSTSENVIACPWSCEDYCITENTDSYIVLKKSTCSSDDVCSSSLWGSYDSCKDFLEKNYKKGVQPELSLELSDSYKQDFSKFETELVSIGCEPVVYCASGSQYICSGNELFISWKIDVSDLQECCVNHKVGTVSTINNKQVCFGDDGALIEIPDYEVYVKYGSLPDEDLVKFILNSKIVSETRTFREPLDEEVGQPCNIINL
ncbi:hypothetical protein L6249_00730 [Candidatus Parcubacteria bacterium]|nr:hypothetical protein [Candidatus Parcubacteria bacterium]